MLDLVVIDPSPRFTTHLRGYRARVPARPPDVRLLVPRIRIRPDEYGVVVRFRTRPGIGLAEVQEHAQHLADAWGCTRVAVTQDRPGRVVIRAVRCDPLTVPTVWVPSSEVPTVEQLRAWTLGVDEYAEHVAVRLANVAGISIAGLPGTGKTSVISSLLARYAPSPCVQFAVIDGKAAGDYDDVTGRLFAHLGDDLEAANDLFARLVQLRRRRATRIRERVAAGGLGVRNFWAAGPPRGGR
jgi:S-DNA-T family DNA segregation ATPase FtsK/SpoIIIE